MVEIVGMVSIVAGLVLVAAISDPDHVSVSETQQSRMTAAAWHFVNIFWSA